MRNTITISIFAGLLTVSAFATEKKYTCLPMGDDDVQDSMNLTIVSPSEIRMDEQKGSLDKNYVPRLNKSFVRFDLDSADPESLSEALVQKKLLRGATKGLIKLQARGEVFNTETLTCTKD